MKYSIDVISENFWKSKKKKKKTVSYFKSGGSQQNQRIIFGRHLKSNSLYNKDFGNYHHRIPRGLGVLLMANGLFLMYDVIASRLMCLIKFSCLHSVGNLIWHMLQKFQIKRSHIYFLANFFFTFCFGDTLKVAIVSRSENNLYYTSEFQQVIQLGLRRLSCHIIPKIPKGEGRALGGGAYGRLAGNVLCRPWSGRFPQEISSVSDRVSIFRNIFRFGRK